MKGTLIKKSQQKRRTSPSNYKERFFVLDTQDLTYSERRPGVCTVDGEEDGKYYQCTFESKYILSLLVKQ